MVEATSAASVPRLPRRRLLVALWRDSAAVTHVSRAHRAHCDGNDLQRALEQPGLRAHHRDARAADADIVALQELRPEHLPAISAALAPDYPYSSTLDVDLYHTVGLLSRFPIDSVTPLADPPFERALLARVLVEGRPLDVVVAHLTPTNALDRGLSHAPQTITERYARRQQQAEALVALARSEAAPLVVLCDCNLTPTSEAYATLRAALVDSFAEAGSGFGHTMLVPVLDLPAQRLDYIWHAPSLVVLEAQVGPDGGSDHLPVLVKLTWP